jgi:quercetin dioxygenase-like cupin family protein
MTEPVGGIRRPRRIVTGLREDGTSYLARVEEVEEIDYGGAYPDRPTRARATEGYRIWAWDKLPLELPIDGLTVDIEGDPSAQETPDALRRSLAVPRSPSEIRVTVAKFLPREPGQPASPGAFHWNDTLVIQFLISGSLTVLLDDGSEITMQPGDVMVQPGTNHAWFPGAEGAVMGIVVLGANRVGISPRSQDRGARH